MEPWNRGTMELWNHETIEPWNHGTVKPWNHRTMEPWNHWKATQTQYHFLAVLGFAKTTALAG